jgi:hypothetical protein
LNIDSKIRQKPTKSLKVYSNLPHIFFIYK